MLKISQGIPIPPPRLGRKTNRDLPPIDEFPFVYMADGRSFTIPSGGRDTSVVRQMFWYRYNKAVEERLIGEGSRFSLRANDDGALTVWCVKWCPPLPGVQVMDPPEHLRGEGWGDPVETGPEDDLI